MKVYINEINPWINEMQNNLKCNSLQQFRISSVKEMQKFLIRAICQREKISKYIGKYTSKCIWYKFSSSS